MSIKHLPKPFLVHQIVTSLIDKGAVPCTLLIANEVTNHYKNKDSSSFITNFFKKQTTNNQMLRISKGIEECASAYKKMKLENAYQSIVFQYNKDFTEIMVETTTPRVKPSQQQFDVAACKESFEQFIKSLPNDDCRFVAYHLDFEVSDEQSGVKTVRSKLIFILFSGDKAPVKNKMLYSTSCMDFKQRLDGVGIGLQGSRADLTYESCLEKVFRFVRT